MFNFLLAHVDGNTAGRRNAPTLPPTRPSILTRRHALGLESTVYPTRPAPACAGVYFGCCRHVILPVCLRGTHTRRALTLTHTHAHTNTARRPGQTPPANISSDIFRCLIYAFGEPALNPAMARVPCFCCNFDSTCALAGLQPAGCWFMRRPGFRAYSNRKVPSRPGMLYDEERQSQRLN